ncbi:uncharacterized protein ColSpa_00531 [Colletotrichum spaethianum]|uniref:Uncharacterized protein n=1 Tax=Colletotrichum spaethianum TaxID=700344 RepID=A0AA37L532_9PEZI|nr:uncharacterized protein ColSpa_00531 [Colletotrichum spaethianum]GKT40350.1 hypothetical protein ColSpa_00531 [Colletotrichum spaethianum]
MPIEVPIAEIQSRQMVDCRAGTRTGPGTLPAHSIIARRQPGPNHLSSELIDLVDMFQPLETGPSLREPREQPWNPADWRHEPQLSVRL